MTEPKDSDLLRIRGRKLDARLDDLDARRHAVEESADEPDPATVRRLAEEADDLAVERDHLADAWDQVADDQDRYADDRDVAAVERDRGARTAADTSGYGLDPTDREVERFWANRDRDAATSDRTNARAARKRAADDRARAADARARARKARDRDDGDQSYCG